MGVAGTGAGGEGSTQGSARKRRRESAGDPQSTGDPQTSAEAVTAAPAVAAAAEEEEEDGPAKPVIGEDGQKAEAYTRPPFSSS